TEQPLFPAQVYGRHEEGSSNALVEWLLGEPRPVPRRGGQQLDVDDWMPEMLRMPANAVQRSLCNKHHPLDRASALDTADVIQQRRGKGLARLLPPIPMVISWSLHGRGPLELQ